MSDLGELIYFPVMAKGLQLACIAEMSGLPWTGFTVEDEGPKSWGEIKASGVAPFGQMPLLKTPSGLVLGQSCAIANYIAKMAGAALEGESDNDYALSQMLMAEAEDIYSLLGSCELANWKTPEQRESAAEKAKTLFAEQLPAHFKNLEELASSDVSDEGKHSDCKFTTTGHTAGEIYLLGMIHQAVLAGGGLALNASKPVRGGAIALYYPRLVGWCKSVSSALTLCLLIPQPSLLASARRQHSARAR
jgi:glutathione S-transferase